MAIDVPVLLCVFNRPRLTETVFAEIARQRPKHLLISGDGPRADHPNDVELVRQTQRIVERVDWDCVVQARFAAKNLGCRAHMAEAITWGFEQHERLIILEDDCLPNRSFFQFCDQLLDRYAETQQVMMISGNTYPTDGFGDCSYRFSKYPLIWGWASWRRAWQQYDLDMKLWDSLEVQSRVLNQFTESNKERTYWKNIFDHQRAGQINTWDYSWTFACWANSGRCVLPRQNLVSNIGFGDAATHTFDVTSPMANRSTFPIEITRHPESLHIDRDADQAIRRIVFEPEIVLPTRKSLASRLWDLSTWPFSATGIFQN